MTLKQKMEPRRQWLHRRLVRACTGMCLLAVLCLFVRDASAQAAGGIRGTVTDAAKKPLAEVGVEISEVSGKPVQGGFVLTGRDGGFVLQVPPGAYDLKVTAPGHEPRTFKGLNVKAGGFTEQQVTLSGSTVQIDEMKVVGKPRQASDFTQMMKRQAAAGIMDNIAADTIKKIPESDVAGILTRMPGVVISEGKYMQARGMTKRYNNTILNGAVVPTTRPNEKLTPLDLFPGGVVDSISVAKTFTPDLPGNFSGGLCQIKTKALPDGPQVKLGYTAKYNTETTGEDYLTYNGGGKDWAGYDDGTRKLPHIIPGIKIGNTDKDTAGSVGVSAREREKLGESFDNTWNTHRRNAHLQSDYEFTAGDRMGKFGLVMSTYYKSDIKNYIDEERTYYAYAPASPGGQDPALSYDFERSRLIIKEGGLLNFGYEFSADHKMYFTNFYNRNTTDEARIALSTYHTDDASYYKTTKLRYIEEEFYSGGVAGDHRFDELLKSRVKWRYNFSLARMNDPDQRSNTYEFVRDINGNPTGEYILSSKKAEALLRQFSEQDEDMDDLAVDWSLEAPSPWSWLEPKFQFGAAYTKRDRDFYMRRFAFGTSKSRQVQI